MVPPVPCVISQDAEPNARNNSYLVSRVWYHKMQDPTAVTNRTVCLVCDIARCRGPMHVASRTSCFVCDIVKHTTQCPQQIVPPILTVRWQTAEPNAHNKSFPLFRVWYQKMQNPLPVTNRVWYRKMQDPTAVANRTPCLVWDFACCRTKWP